MIRLIRNAALCVAWTLVVIGLGYAMAFVTVNAVTDYASFCVGATLPFGVIAALAGFWWSSHPSTKQWPGTVIGFTTAVIMVVVAAVWRPFDHFSVGDFGWGVLALVVVAAATAAFAVVAKSYNNVP